MLYSQALGNCTPLVTPRTLWTRLFSPYPVTLPLTLSSPCQAAGKRAPSEATLALDEEADDAAGRAADAEAEFERAKERLTLRHRNTSKWARRALKRGVEVRKGKVCVFG